MKFISLIITVVFFLMPSNIIAATKDPFYFGKNNIPVHMKNGKFSSAETGYGFSFGFIEGVMADDVQMEMLPLVSEPLSSLNTPISFPVDI